MADKRAEDLSAVVMSRESALEELEGRLREFFASSVHPDEAAQEMARLMGACMPEQKESAWLDAAALFAARHPALEGHEPHLRSHLALLAHRHDFAWQIAGEPRVVIEAAEQQAMIQARLLGEAVDAIWREPMFEPKDAAVALGAKASNREKVRVHRERSWLLGLPRDRRYLYPAFQFDPLRRSVFPEVQTVNELLGAADDPWGVASWWVSVNARIDSAPLELVGIDRSEDLLAVAAAAVEPVG